ncbi:L,D-transpeptidase family protein [Altererythrobacter sp. GH1-8]|uniref:L,D-transpeptidase family protein n=1 Tax=Altererythrobacter sp. GH1-8 TaxID=3349333 RepID=UPI00374CB91A
MGFILAMKLIFSALFLSGCGSAPSMPAASPFDQVVEQTASVNPIPEDKLRAAASDPVTRQFYEANGWHAVWSIAATKAFRRSLGERARHGLDHLSYLATPDASFSTARREILLTHAALSYSAALAQGQADPTQLHKIYTLSRPQIALNQPLKEALAAGNLETWLESLAPQDAVYTRLSKAYLSAQWEAKNADQAIIAAGVIHVGDTDRRVPAIVKALIAGGYLTAQDTTFSSSNPKSLPADAALYTRGIANGVMELQRSFGIEEDGIIGPDTLELLNVRPGDQAKALAVALERLRWLTRTPPATRIDVNTADAQLYYYRNGELVDNRRVIVGLPGNETPQLLAPIFRLVANPTWTIPKSIQHGEMAGVSNSYLRRHNMVRRNGWIIQLSGPSNALGLVKFDMRNDQAIFLHDTSAPLLFGRSQRHLSHGCVRVENAEDLAKLIAEDEGIGDKWQQARGSSRQIFVDLPSQIPVRLLYQNVFVDRTGEVAFRTDPYGWNAPIASALGFKEVSRAKAMGEVVDIGP